jgi:hypothetical protein
MKIASFLSFSYGITKTTGLSGCKNNIYENEEYVQKV